MTTAAAVTNKEKWPIPLPASKLSQLIEQELTVTPFSSFCKKKGYDNSKQAFPLYKRLSAHRISIPRQFMLDHFPLEKCAPFNVYSANCGWATPKEMVQPLSVPLRPLQHEIIYDKLLPHLANCYYQSPDNSGQSFFFGGGLIILPCGYGKTKTVEEFFYAISQYVPNGYRMLCICPTKAIAKQTAIAFRRDLKGCKVAILRAADSAAPAAHKAPLQQGKRVLVAAAHSSQPSSSSASSPELPEKVRKLIRSVDVVVTLMSTLKSRNYGPEFYSHFGIVVIDEVHHMTAKGNSQLFFEMNPPVMIGLTAEYENKANTFSLLEKCIGPRIFEKRDRDGQDDIVVRKCQINDEVLRYIFRGKAHAEEKIARLQSIVENEKGEMDYTKTISNLIESEEMQQFWCEHILFMVDSIPEDQFFMNAMKSLMPLFSPVESPDLCGRCSQECVFGFEVLVHGSLFCQACVTDIYFNHGNQWEGERDFLPRLLRRKTKEDELEEEDRKKRKAAKKPRKKTKKNPRKRKAAASSLEESFNAVVFGEGDEADEVLDSDDEDVDEGLLQDAQLEEMMQESLDISRSIYEGTYFGRNQILVLCERVKPLCRLADLLQQRRPSLVGEVGNIAGKNGNELELQRSRGRQIILATLPKAKEGMDIPTINTVMNTTPTTTIRQGMGRALRTKCRKYVFDFIYPNRLFWLQFQNHRKPEYDAHGCRYENFKLPQFVEWKRRSSRAEVEEEEEEEVKVEEDSLDCSSSLQHNL